MAVHGPGGLCTTFVAACRSRPLRLLMPGYAARRSRVAGRRLDGCLPARDRLKKTSLPFPTPPLTVCQKSADVLCRRRRTHKQVSYIPPSLLHCSAFSASGQGPAAAVPAMAPAYPLLPRLGIFKQVFSSFFSSFYLISMLYSFFGKKCHPSLTS